MGTFVNNLRLLEITTGDESGTWGTKTNLNLELIADAFGSGTEAITTNADTHTTTIADGAADEGRAIFLKYTGTLDSACTITLAPNTVNKLWFIENATSGSQNIIISQGSGANITIGNGNVAAVYTDGAGSGAAVLDAFADLELSSKLTVAGNVDFNGDLDVDGTTNLDAVDIDGAVQIDSTVTVGVDDTGYDVKFFGATSGAYMLWDESADDLVLAGAAGLDVAGDIDVDGTTNLDVVDIDGAVDMASTLTVAGNVDFNGDLDVDGTTNLDAVDIDGAVDMASTLTVAGNVNMAGSLTIDKADATPTFNVIRSDSSIAASNLVTLLQARGDLGSGAITGATIGIRADEDWVQDSNSGTRIAFTTSTNGTWNSDVERMRIDHNGNIGIGSENPGALLELKESSTAAGDAVIRLRGNGNNADNTVLGALEWYNADSSGDQAGVVCRIEGVSGNSNGHMGEILFKTHDGSEGGEGSNPVERMRIDNSGDVGIGTASPAVKLHVEDSVEEVVRVKGSGNTGAVYIDADGGGSSGRGGMVVAQQNSSTCGVFGVTGAYRGNTNADVGIFAESGRRIEFAVNGTTDPVMVVHSGGNIGIGTISPANTLQVAASAVSSVPAAGASGHKLAFGSSEYGVAGGALTNGNSYLQVTRWDGTATNYDLLAQPNGGNVVIGRASASAGNTDAGHVLYGAGQHYIFSSATQCVRFYETSGSGQQVGSISITSSATSFNTSSDQRLKDNITDAPSASDDIDAIRIRSFDWKVDGSHQKYGIVAQELVAVTPAAVNQPEDADEMMGIDYSKLVPMLIKEIQSLRDRVASLETN